jgi:hypothetical protein
VERIAADLLGLRPAIWPVAAITAASDLIVAVRMYELATRPPHRSEPIHDN